MQEKEVHLLEVSWEVCNKVGGIYTVLSSKAPHISPRVPDYTLIGPYFSNHHQPDFMEEMIPDNLREVFADLKSNGIVCHYGKWLIKSQPRVILIEFSSLFSEKNNLKSMFWDKYGVDSLNSGFDFDEPVVFSVAAAKVIDTIQRKSGQKTIAQFHEWMTGAGILYLKQINPNVATIFTTHATVLGRALAGVNSSFYDILDSIDIDREARSHGVLSKHHMERASAQTASVFTAVSEITAFEAEKLLGRKTDFVLPNGIDLGNFSSFEDISIRHSQLKKEIKNFISSFFFPYYSFDLDETLIYFILGRYEYENKGIDVLIESLGMLNKTLKSGKSNKTVVTFFFIPAATSSIRHDVIENRTIFYDLKTTIDREKTTILDRILFLSASGEKIKKVSPFSDIFIETLQKKVNNFKKKGSPGYSTHELSYYDSDAIIQGFRNAGLNNNEEDKVKVIFYPTYIRSSDNLINLDLYDVITGGHLGIFPSAYEPWGYTPMESAALGVASITSDLSGFGRYMQNEVRNKNPGIFILKRFGISRKDVVNSLYESMNYYASLDKEGRIENKIEARKLASLVDWKKLIEFYFKAYDLAYSKV